MMKPTTPGLFKSPAPFKPGHLSVVQPRFDSFEPVSPPVQHELPDAGYASWSGANSVDWHIVRIVDLLEEG